MTKIVADDIWDPRLWLPDDHEYRIYADDSLEDYVVVDKRHYPALVKFKWSNFSKKKSDRGHLYLRRTITEFLGPDGPKYESQVTGKLVRNRKRIVRTRFLHIEVLLLSGKKKPTRKHKEGDHINRKTRDCREDNLQWATRKMQVQNSDFAGNMQKARNARWGKKK